MAVILPGVLPSMTTKGSWSAKALAGKNLHPPSVFLYGNYGRFVGYDAFAFYIDEGIRSAKVNGEVVGKQA